MKLLNRLSHKPAAKVTSYGQIKAAAADMLTLLNADKFAGKYDNGFALHHAQVSNEPLNFFVTHRSWENVLPSIVVNAKIIERMEPLTFKEACLSFPFRDPIKTPRYWRVIVEYEEYSKARSWFANGLRPQQMAFDGLAALIFQHENDHAIGKNIYNA